MIRKYYEYEGLGGGIDPKSTSNAQPMTQQTMTKEQILEKSFNTLLKAKFGSIVGEFSEANTNNGYE